MWADPSNRLLAAIATAVERVKYLTAIGQFGDQMVSDRMQPGLRPYLSSVWGPQIDIDTGDVVDESAAADAQERRVKAAEVADGLRDELFG